MKILITGGAGSLGREFVKYLKDHDVTIVDSSEWAIAEMTCKKILGDFADIDVKGYDLVIHTAAYKHINLCEENPDACIDNNISKTQDLFKRCHKYGVRNLFISTDKSVRPISLYGFTKSIGERLCWHYGGQVARCGNFYGSSGSVIPIWEKAFKEGKPLPITDPEMTRFMISTEEVVKQIWQVFLDGKKLIIPEMGEPIKLKDLVDKLYPNYPTEIIGIRPFEKMEEVLRWDWEEKK
jgi:FlaA1/EpsC-like NDP-sugar epimerase